MGNDARTVDLAFVTEPLTGPPGVEESPGRPGGVMLGLAADAEAGVDRAEP